MKKLYLHVGLYKTGSTYFQAQLQRNAPSLAKQNIFVPLGNDWKEVYALLTSIRDKSPVTLPTLKLYREIMSGIKHKSVLSCESLCHLPDPELMADQINFIFSGFEIEIIAVLRRQDAILESMYMQNVKAAGFREPFSKHFKDIERDNFDWFRWCNAFSAVFPKFHVFPYKRPGVINWMFSIFTDIQPMLKDEIFNPGLSPLGTKIMLACNKSLPPEELPEIKTFLEATTPKLKGEKFNIMSAEQRKDILDYYRESNGKVFDKYMPEYLEEKKYYMEELCSG